MGYPGEMYRETSSDGVNSDDTQETGLNMSHQQNHCQLGWQGTGYKRWLLTPEGPGAGNRLIQVYGREQVLPSMKGPSLLGDSSSPRRCSGPNTTHPLPCWFCNWLKPVRPFPSSLPF